MQLGYPDFLSLVIPKSKLFPVKEPFWLLVSECCTYFLELSLCLFVLFSRSSFLLQLGTLPLSTCLSITGCLSILHTDLDIDLIMAWFG